MCHDNVIISCKYAITMSHISYNDETLHSYILPKEDPKNVWITWRTPWVLLTSVFFQLKSANFAISRNTDIDCILIHNYFFQLFLMMSAKMVTLGLLKINVFWNKGYDVIILVYDVTNKISSCDSNYVMDVSMLPKFGNSSISMTEVIKTSIL